MSWCRDHGNLRHRLDRRRLRADEVALYIAELIAEAPPLPVTVARLLRYP